MAAIKRLIQSSLAWQLYLYFTQTAVPALFKLWDESGVMRLWRLFDAKIIQSRPVQYLINPKYISEAWYASFFYQSMTRNIRRLGLVLPAASLPFRSEYLGFFLMLVLLLPASLTGNVYILPLFLALALAYTSHALRSRAGVVFVMVNYIIAFFLLLLALAVPLKAFTTLCYLLLAIDFFFLVSFSIQNLKDLQRLLACVYVLLFALCAYAILQEPGYSGVRGVFKDSASFAEILIILFPFALVYPLSCTGGLRRFLYLGLLLILTFTVVTATRSKAALIGFSIELLLVILLTDIRYLPLLLFLAPAVTGTAIDNIAAMFEKHATYGNFFENIFYACRDFWNNGFGLSRATFLDIYHSTALDAETGHAVLDIPYVQISPIYFNLLIDAGTIVLFGFLYYILRLAHSALTSLFTAAPEHRPVFAAGLAMLVGISVSALFESTLLSPRALIAYWGMLGILRAMRVIKFDVLACH